MPTRPLIPHAVPSRRESPPARSISARSCNDGGEAQTEAFGTGSHSLGGHARLGRVVMRLGRPPGTRQRDRGCASRPRAARSSASPCAKDVHETSRRGRRRPTQRPSAEGQPPRSRAHPGRGERQLPLGRCRGSRARAEARSLEWSDEGLLPREFQRARPPRRTGESRPASRLASRSRSFQFTFLRWPDSQCRRGRVADGSGPLGAGW